jgi:hypothetical protein
MQPPGLVHRPDARISGRSAWRPSQLALSLSVPSVRQDSNAMLLLSTPPIGAQAMVSSSRLVSNLYSASDCGSARPAHTNADSLTWLSEHDEPLTKPW